MFKKDIHGMLLFDKPAGISSNKILQIIKRMFHVKKAGYIGTLDPLATGLLPICFGESTKFVEYFTNSKKYYYTKAKLGEITDTYDAEGVKLEYREVKFSKLELLQALEKLKKKTIQTVPNYSAVKYKGRPLYAYARKNIFIPSITRNIKIYKLNCIKYSNKFIELEIICSKGTYIRSLIHDLGQILQCGAHIVALRRLKIENYSIAHTITLKQLHYIIYKYHQNEYYRILFNFLIPVKKLFFQLPEVICDNYNFIHNQNKIGYCFSADIPRIFRMTIHNDSTIFAIVRTNKTGQCISYKLLNIK